jgi:sulfate adenylyltransferase
MLTDGEDLPETFSRPEVAKVLQAYYAGIKDEDKVEIKMSGHSAQ